MNVDQMKRRAVLMVAIFDALGFEASLDERIHALSEVLGALIETRNQLADKKLGITK